MGGDAALISSLDCADCNSTLFECICIVVVHFYDPSDYFLVCIIAAIEPTALEFCTISSVVAFE